jgi:hypothetical protein
MPFHLTDGIRYYTFETIQAAGALNAAISRRGGVSPPPWASLNVGATVGDDFQRVLENRRRSFQALSRPLESLYDVWQVHGTEVVCASAPRPLHQPHLRADAILTDRPEVTLFMRFADCVPIFLFDPVRRVVGLVHAGWLGTVKKTALSAVQAMQTSYGSRPADILAAIGPSICPDHYPVGPEVEKQVRQAFSQNADHILKSSNGVEPSSGVKFDLWGANRLVLEEAGVRQIECANICTACQMDDWYSHRGEQGSTGRFGALIALLE